MNERNSTQFGKYRLESEIGRGGFGTVYRATDTTLDRPVALKVMEPMLMRDTVWVTRFKREAKLMAKLDHPNIVPIHEIDEINEQLLIAMKLVDGTDLAHYIRENGRLEWNQIYRIMEQVASALDYAYGLKIVHRDLKPANILLSGDHAALTDFGFARLVGDNSQSISVIGSIVGTPAYIAPEVWEGESQGSAGDIYALGCVLYEMATGEVLFQGDSAPSIMLAHFRPPPLPLQLNEDVPPHALSVIKKALAKEPEDRFATATEMVQALLSDQPEETPADFALQLKERADAALASGDLSAADSLITSLQRLFPDDPDLPGLLQRIERAKDGIQSQPPSDPPPDTAQEADDKIHVAAPEQQEKDVPKKTRTGLLSLPTCLIAIVIMIAAACFLSICYTLVLG